MQPAYTYRIIASRKIATRPDSITHELYLPTL